MTANDRLYRAFLEEMRALEGFRQAYTAEHPTAPLGREDPDVRRLIEALGFFAARARLASQSSVDATRQRIQRQLLPYMLSPLPSMGIVDAAPNGKLSETLVMPRGSELEVRAPNQPSAIFRTLRDTRILPVRLVRVDTLPRANGGYRILFAFESAYPRNDEIGRLSFFVDYLDDYFASLGAITAVEKNLKGASLLADEPFDAEATGSPCGISFGLPAEDAEEAWPHPVLRERNFFHFPAMQHFINVDVRDALRNWRKFAIAIDVGDGWPRALRLNRNVIRPFAVPITNTQRAMSQPILCDGTKERWPVRHARPVMKFELQQIRGVFRVTEGGLVPLRPGTLGGGNGSYELVEDEQGDGPTTHALLLHMPAAVEKPATVAVDGEWYQPWFSRAIGENMRVAPYRRSTIGVDWEIAGRPTAHRDMVLHEHTNELMSVLVMQQKTRLNRHDLDTLLAGLGSVWTGHFGILRDVISEVTVREVPLQQASGSSGIKLVYALRLREHDQSLRPLLEAFARHLQLVLDAWIAETPVEVRLSEGT